MEIAVEDLRCYEVCKSGGHVIVESSSRHFRLRFGVPITLRTNAFLARIHGGGIGDSTNKVHTCPHACDLCLWGPLSSWFSIFLQPSFEYDFHVEKQLASFLDILFLLPTLCNTRILLQCD